MLCQQCELSGRKMLNFLNCCQRILLEEYPEGARAPNRTFEHCLATEFAFDCIEDEGYLEKLQMLLKDFR